MWNRLEEYFTFNRGYKNAIIALVILSVAVFVVPRVYLYFKPVEHTSNTLIEKEVQAFIEEYNQRKQLANQSDSLEDSNAEKFNPYSSIDINPAFETEKKKAIEYFDFDPNKIGEAEWVRLGFSEKQAKSIEKLKSKGYKFYKPEDLKTVYVIGEENYTRLLPYIKINPANFPKKEFPKTVYPDKPKEKFVVDINTADSSLFERQRGIGPSLASRIIKYRNRLGGFISVQQISEVWGMPDSTYQSLKERFVVNDASVTRLNLNSSDVPTMGKHPYINFPLAKVIDAYRKQHGNFKTVNELKKVALVTDSIYTRMEPYIYVE